MTSASCSQPRATCSSAHSFPGFGVVVHVGGGVAVVVGGAGAATMATMATILSYLPRGQRFIRKHQLANTGGNCWRKAKSGALGR